MGLYEELKADADALLAELGQDMTLVRPGAGESYDPVTGASSGEPDQEFAVKGVVVDFEQKDLGMNLMNGGATIQGGDKKVIIQAVVRPAVNDRLRVGPSSESWGVVGWNEVNPAGVALIYELQVRR